MQKLVWPAAWVLECLVTSYSTRRQVIELPFPQQRCCDPIEAGSHGDDDVAGTKDSIRNGEPGGYSSSLCSAHVANNNEAARPSDVAAQLGVLPECLSILNSQPGAAAHLSGASNQSMHSFEGTGIRSNLSTRSTSKEIVFGDACAVTERAGRSAWASAACAHKLNARAGVAGHWVTPTGQSVARLPFTAPIETAEHRSHSTGVVKRLPPLHVRTHSVHHGWRHHIQGK